MGRLRSELRAKKLPDYLRRKPVPEFVCFIIIRLGFPVIRERHPGIDHHFRESIVEIIERSFDVTIGRDFLHGRVELVPNGSMNDFALAFVAFAIGCGNRLVRHI